MNPINVPRVPIDRQCEITERIDHMEIEFTTTCPGVPHWISMAYYPNWHVDGASRIYLASPAFMLVIPDGPRVRIHFARIGADWEGFSANSEELIDGGERIVSLGHYTGVSKATGKSMRAQFAHVFSVKNGKIASFQQYADTLGTAKALEK